MNYSESYIKAAQAELAKIELARRRLIPFVQQVKPDYDARWFHRAMAERLEAVERGEIQRLMLFLPPQHGKTQISTRSFPAWYLGRQPDTKIAVVSYSATIASGFNRDIQRIIDTEEYHRVFPGTTLNESNVVTLAKGVALRNSEMFEVVGRSGYVFTVGRGGPLTSKTVDLGIIDDPLKDREEAYSPTIREALWGWYESVFQTRLHNNSRQVLIQTRWHEDDLGGRLLARDGVYNAETNPRGWIVVKFPGIRTNELNSYDPRGEGEALWPEKHSLETLEAIRRTSPVIFNALYQQDPKPSREALIYPDWAECEAFPDDCETVFYGLDFGFTNDPAAYVKIGRINDRLYLDELFYETGLTNPDIAHRMKAIGTDKARNIADSAEPKSIEELRRLGIVVFPAEKGPGSLNAGIDKVKTFKVFYTARSRNIAREAKNYQWVMNGGVATNVPVDAHNHGLDAVRYACSIVLKSTPLKIWL